MPKLEDVQKWLQTKYDLAESDAKYIVRMVINDEKERLIESFISLDLEDDPEEQLKVTKQVDNLLQAYKEQFKSDRPRPKSKPLEFTEAEPSPRAKVPEKDIHAKVAEEIVADADGHEKPAKKAIKSRRDQRATPMMYPYGSKSKSNRRVPEIQVTDIKAPPKYPLSHGMGVVQIKMLKHLIKSVKDNPFNMNDPDSGGIPLDDARPVFATLLMRGGVCDVVDALKVKKSGKKFWGKRVIPIMPMAQKVINDFKKRKPDKWKVVEEVSDV